MPTLHAVGGIATPALAPGAGRDFMVEIPPSSSVLAPGRPCLRSVPAHRIVGGGLGRRYDQAARLSDRHYACDRQRRSSLWVPPATSSLGGGLTGSSNWAGPLLDGVRALAFPRDNNAAEELAPPAAAAAAGDVDLHRIGGDGPELQPQVVAAGAVLGQVIPVVDLSHRLPDGRNNIGMLTSLCLEAMVNSWESVCGNYLYLPRAYHMPHELCARLLRLLITSRKLTAFTLSGDVCVGRLFTFVCASKLVVGSTLATIASQLACSLIREETASPLPVQDKYLVLVHSSIDVFSGYNTFFQLPSVPHEKATHPPEEHPPEMNQQ